MTGMAVERLLRDRFGVAVEMSDLVGIVCLVTIGDSPARADRLVTALATIAAEAGVAPVIPIAPVRSAGAVTAPGEQACSPRDAFSARTRDVAPDAAVGEVAAELVVPYPPGIPVLVPGERITAQKRDYIIEMARRGDAGPGLTPEPAPCPVAARSWHARRPSPLGYTSPHNPTRNGSPDGPGWTPQFPLQ